MFKVSNRIIVGNNPNFDLVNVKTILVLISIYLYFVTLLRYVRNASFLVGHKL